MKITHFVNGETSRIHISGPFWQLNKARRIAAAGLHIAPVNKWEAVGLTFKITLYGQKRQLQLNRGAINAHYGFNSAPL
jgi:hypothetical protein